jgi:hypothetical protein
MSIPYTPIQNRYDPQIIKSTYETAYKPNAIQQNPPIHATSAYRPTRGKFEGESEYKKNYVPTKIQPEQPITPVRYAPNHTKFEGTTTYNREFSPKAMDRRTGCNPEPYRPKNLPFEGTSTYEREYKAHKVEAQRPETHDYSRYMGKNSRFEGESSYTKVTIF